MSGAAWDDQSWLLNWYGLCSPTDRDYTSLWIVISTLTLGNRGTRTVWDTNMTKNEFYLLYTVKSREEFFFCQNLSSKGSEGKFLRGRFRNYSVNNCKLNSSLNKLLFNPFHSTRKITRFNILLLLFRVYLSVTTLVKMQLVCSAPSFRKNVFTKTCLVWQHQKTLPDMFV